MSKIEHDTGAAIHRTEIANCLDKPWYKSSSDLLSKCNISNVKCFDLCCGTGDFSQILRDRHNMQVVCADYIPYHLERIEKLGFDTVHIDIDADSGNVDEIAAQYEGQFDLVVNMAAIEHVFDSDNLLRVAHTVLKPGGLLLVNTPNIAFIGNRIYSIFAGNRPVGEGHHIRFWDYRFLRTNLFLNGFSVIEYGRKFFALPQDSMLRALRNRKQLASFFAWFFHGCKIFQHVPFLRGLCSDELTVLACKDNVPAIGFELHRVQKFLKQSVSTGEYKVSVERLKQAREKGWLDEHLYLSKIVDDLS